MSKYLAIDIGASSGRHILGWMENEDLKTEEIYRFPNGVVRADGHLIWDIDALLGHVKEGIRLAKDYVSATNDTDGNPDTIKSLSIDTWAVDYVLMKGDQEVYPVYAYRDSRTEAVIPKVHEKIPFSELYRRTGIQFQPFNSIYQLYADKEAGRLEGVTDWLMIPEYLLYKLCGTKAREYTNATTSGLVSASTGEFDTEILDRLDLVSDATTIQIQFTELSDNLFPPLTRPGTVLGEYEGIQVVLCTTHDTGAAVEGILMDGDHAYISSGTWSLLGAKTEKPITDKASEAANYSNEGGVGYNRYQKNIMGMWLVNRLRDDLCPDKTFAEIVEEAEKSEYGVMIDANAPEFLAPKSMKEAFGHAISEEILRFSKELEKIAKKPDPMNLTFALPESIGDYFRCAYRSLALCYKGALEELEKNTGKTYEKLYIVGGGAKNQFLNRITEEMTGKTVVALPIEATALGNLRVQMKGEHDVIYRS